VKQNQVRLNPNSTQIGNTLFDVREECGFAA